MQHFIKTIYIILAFTSYILFAQNLPDDWNIGWAIDAADSNHIALSFSDVYVSHDAGKNWQEITPALYKPGETAIDLEMIDENHIWLATGDGNIYGTSDGGNNWQLQFRDSLLTEFMNYIEMFDTQNGIAMGDALNDTLPAVFLKTMDGGENWIMVNTQAFGGFSGDTWRRIDFVNPDTGYFYECCQGSKRFYKTTDGCSTWFTIPEPDPQTGPQLLKFYDADYGLAVTQGQKIYRTTDGGETWQSFSTYHTGWANDIEFDSQKPSRVWFTDNKSMYASYDSGKTWRQFDWLKNDLKARDIAFNRAGDAWVLGDGGNLYSSAFRKSINYTTNRGNDDFDYIATNEILMWFANNGDGSHDPATDGNGLYWPAGINATQSAIFEDGLLWGGIVDGDTVVHGSTYRQGLQPGNIMDNGLAADRDDDTFYIWRANAEWPIISDISAKRMQFDWNNWPIHLGAPYIDKNTNGRYDPKTDDAVVYGDENYWLVMNDLDSVRTNFLYGSNPVGVEMQLSVYAYNQANDLKDVVFKKYTLINKSTKTINNMYISFWSDPDLGDAGDDFIGCDTLLNFGYCYNGDNDDEIYGIPPAAGYLLLQGPVVPAAPNDSAWFNHSWKYGFNNQGMNSFIDFTKSALYQDPSLGTKQGSYETYRYMRGINWTAEAIFDPNTQKPTSYMVPGDPVNDSGWYEGEGWPGGPSPGDRRMMMSAGPVTMAPGDSQEVVYAIIMALGEDRLDSVRKLKLKADKIKNFFYSGVLVTSVTENETGHIPHKFSLGQNYPNPFNPYTKIKYNLPLSGKVKLVVFDALGRQVKILVNQQQNTGEYKVLFNAKDLTSGLYYYKIEAGNNIQTKKMLIIK